MTSWPTRFATPAALLLAAGCLGTIGDNDADIEDGGGSSGPNGKGAKSATVEPLHRLNRLEYDNTVRDLLGVTLTPSQEFPPDGASKGFDNMAAGLSLSPSQMDLYHTAARNLAVAALEDAPRFTHRIEPVVDAPKNGQAGNAFGWGWSLSRQGSKAIDLTPFDVPEDETVTVSILAGGDQVGVNPDTGVAVPVPTMQLLVDGVVAQTWTVAEKPAGPALHTVQLPLPAGTHSLRIFFENGYDQPAANVFNSLIVGTVDVISDVLVTPPGRALVYSCDPKAADDPDACYRDIVTGFLERAWRRPLTDDEATRAFDLWSELRIAEGDDAAVSLMVRSALLSSQFLYRAALPAADAGSDFSGSEGLVALDDFALASRLSYFLWSSMPDEALFEAAREGDLREPEKLRAEVQRMLADDKAAALRKGFAAQWLSTRMLAGHAADDSAFPYFDEPLRAAMIEESELFFDDFLHNGKPINDMLVPDFGYLNDRLAKHYRLPEPGSAELVRVDLSGDQRRGLITLGGWLTAMSASTRTSPVIRGRWILEQVLCEEMPAPPPDVPAFQEPKEGATIRETLAEHRANPTCASCHDKLDPAGLGLEEFDGVGAFRETEKGKPVDSSGAIPPGDEFAGGAALAKLLTKDTRFSECLTEKLYMYAMGRTLEKADKPFLDDIGDELPVSGGSLDKAIELIVLSPAFRMRDGKEVEGK